jgi:predicted transcriptional regulator
MAPKFDARPVSFKIDAGILARIHRLAEARERTAHALMREALLVYVEREEKREQVRADAVQAWAAFAATGLHLDADEAEAWFALLESGCDADAPQCHA